MHILPVFLEFLQMKTWKFCFWHSCIGTHGLIQVCLHKSAPSTSVYVQFVKKHSPSSQLISLALKTSCFFLYCCSKMDPSVSCIISTKQYALYAALVLVHWHSKYISDSWYITINTITWVSIILWRTTKFHHFTFCRCISWVSKHIEHKFHQLRNLSLWRRKLNTEMTQTEWSEHWNDPAAATNAAREENTVEVCKGWKRHARFFPKCAPREDMF